MERLEKKLYFIYNPLAGKGNIRGKLYEIIQTLASLEYEVTVYPCLLYTSPCIRGDSISGMRGTTQTMSMRQTSWLPFPGKNTTARKTM